MRLEKDRSVVAQLLEDDKRGIKETSNHVRTASKLRTETTIQKVG